MSIKLIVSLAGGSEPMSEHAFDKEVVTIGRTLGNDIVLPDVEKKVSSKHARIERKGAAYEILDIGSVNGTYLNGRRIDANRGVVLSPGDRLLIGGFQIAVQSTEDKTESTTRHIDPTKAAEKLSETLAQEYSKHLDSPPDVRREALREAIREGLRYAGPESGRTVLTLVRGRFQGGKAIETGAAANQEVLRREELYRSGYQAISNLSSHFLGDANFQTSDQVEKFCRQITQTLDLTMDWVSNMLKGRREFENQFQADLTMVFSKEGNPLKSSNATNEMARHLLDWRTAKDPVSAKTMLENAFKDIAMHQLGLVAGAQACLKKLLERLDPKMMEQEVAGRGGIFKSKEKQAWEVYSQRHKEMFEENSKLFNELIYPNLREGYLKSHAAGEAVPTPAGKTVAAPPPPTVKGGPPPGAASTLKSSGPPGASTAKSAASSSKIQPPPAPPPAAPPKSEGKAS